MCYEGNENERGTYRSGPEQGGQKWCQNTVLTEMCIENDKKSVKFRKNIP